MKESGTNGLQSFSDYQQQTLKRSDLRQAETLTSQDNHRVSWDVSRQKAGANGSPRCDGPQERNQSSRQLQHNKTSTMGTQKLGQAGMKVLKSNFSNSNLNNSKNSERNGGNLGVRPQQKGGSGIDGALVQILQFKKVKSKTNANPTRQNSPKQYHKMQIAQDQHQGMYQSQQPNQPKVSQLSQTKGDGLSYPNAQGLKISNQQSMVSAPNSPNNNVQKINQNPIIDAQTSDLNAISPRIIHVEKRKESASGVLGKNQGSVKEAVTILSTNNLNVQVQSNNNRKQVRGEKVQQTGAECKVFQNNNRRLNLPSSPSVPGKYIPPDSNPMVNILNDDHSNNNNQANEFQLHSQQTQQLYQTQGVQSLSLAVSQNIGGIASGHHRRENRNQMMKVHHNSKKAESNSVIGSLGPANSLAPFQGLRSDTTQSPSPQTKLVFETQNANNTVGINSVKYSQLQQMHLNNLNPMFFSTGEALNQNGAGSNGLPDWIPAQQMRTMGGPSNPHHYGSPDSPVNGSLKSQNTNQALNKINYEKQTKNKASRCNESIQCLPLNKGGPNGDHLHQANYQQQQIKTTVIQMRKINPISKTAANTSKHTSLDKTKQQNILSSGNSNRIKTQLLSGNPQHSQQNQENNHKLIQNPKLKVSSQQGIQNAQQSNPSNFKSFPGKKQVSQPAVSSPINNPQVLSNQNQNCKKVRHMPIGQPLGDIPIILSNRCARKNSSSTGMNLQTVNNSSYGSQSIVHKQSIGNQIEAHSSSIQPANIATKNNFELPVNAIAVKDQQPKEFLMSENCSLDKQGYINPKKIRPSLSNQTNQEFSGGVSQSQQVSNNIVNQKLPGSNVYQNRANQNHADAGSKNPSVSQNQAAVKSENIKISPDEMGQQYLNQYFKQTKHSSYISINGKYRGQSGFENCKYGQIDSPKDGSIERARQVDIIQDERLILQMNEQLQNMIQDDPSRDANTIQKGKSLTQANNKNQQYIIQQIEATNASKLSPRSKEVFLIKKLIQDCFVKYSKPPKTQLELYKLGKMLGKGAFGKVNLGLHRLTRKLVAIKSINMDFMKEESQKKKIMNEINILKSLRHPNNIKIFETFQTDKHHMIVMELCPGGDLLNYVRKRRKLTEKYAKFVFKQIMEGIAYLHENNVSHRDIKLDNILLDGHGNIKIGDFGVSRKIEENEVLFEQCGTPAYIAPEIVKDVGYKGFPVDIWSAGICLYAMLYGNVPFKANQIGDLNAVEQLNQEIEYKDTVSAEAIELMKLMLQKAPRLRATAHEVLSHEWLNDLENQNEHIDIFDEQELELIRKEFTYAVQKKKLKEFKEQKERLHQSGQQDNLICHLASRRPDDLNTEFTECSIMTHENSLLKNDSSRSVILCPFNTQTGDKTADKIIAQSANLMRDKDLMIRFHPRVRELDRNYEKLNNQDFDNGVYHKYAYKQKKKLDDNNVSKEDEIKEENINQSDVNMNNLVPDGKNELSRKRQRQKADINYHNYYIKINENIIKDVSRLGFPEAYIHRCLKENANNHCTTTYYLLCMDQNF